VLQILSACPNSQTYVFVDLDFLIRHFDLYLITFSFLAKVFFFKC